MSTKTVHTPPTGAVSGSEIKFPAATIQECSRAAANSALVSFRCDLKPKDLETLFTHMKWQIPGETASLEKLDGKLKGGYFILTAKLGEQPASRIIAKAPDGSIDTTAEIDLNFDEISGFECHRLELKGHKKKGRRRELRFKAKFGDNCQDAMAELESFMVRTGDAAGTLKVIFYPEAVQEPLVQPEDDKQGSLEIGEVHATEEQRAAAAEIPVETGTLASTRQMGAKRGRLVDTKAN